MYSKQLIGRALVYNLLDILTTIRSCVSVTNEYSRDFLSKYIDWLSSIMSSAYNSDAILYSPLHKHMVTSLTHFLKRPETYLGIDYFDLTFSEYWDIKANCRRFSDIVNDEEFHSGGMENFFNNYVSRLEHILENTDYASLKEENREFYLDLTRYIGNPDRIQRISSQFDMDFCEYLDAIDM